MAANSGAYYEGLQYASQGVQPVNFGELSMGFAKIVEDKRLEEKRDKEKREATQMEMTRLFGEEIYSSFDGTGLADIDIVNSKIKDSIVARANVINSMYEKGELTNPQMMQEMVKLNAQSSKYASFANSISTKVEEIQKLGGNASEYTTLMLERIDNLMKNASPVMDSSGNLSFLTKDGDQIVSNPFNELQKLLDVREKYDTDSIINSVLRSRGKEKVIEGGVVVEKLSDLNENDEKAFRDVVSTLDDADKFDIAMRAMKAGGKVDRDPNSVFKILNTKEVEDTIVNYMKETAQGRIDQVKTVDEVAGFSIESQRKRDAIAASRVKEDKVTVIENESNGYDVIGKPVAINTIKVSGKPVSDIIVTGYSVDQQGRNIVEVEYNEIKEIGIESVKVPRTERVPVDDLSTLNKVRVLYGKLEPVKSMPPQPEVQNAAQPFIGPQQPAKPKAYQ
jgi:hypothetical protein